MCGIAGYIDLKTSTSEEVLERHALAMAGAMVRRGPDDQGAWTDAQAGVALAQARLSIIDLSEAGHQPMVSHNGRYVIVYNGEVYNAEDLRAHLDGVDWRGHSDTEVILEACARWGLTVTLEKLIGMFAFALWDREERTLSLVRDRFGIKPLYWGEVDGKFLFASELKALMALKGWTRRIDRNALASYMRFNYVPAPQSIFQGLHKLQPGHILTFHAGRGAVDIERYWNVRAIAAAGARNPLKLDDAQAEDELDRLVRDAVKRRMVADVPLGAFLSGGIDSSTVVAAMQAQSVRAVKTFTIGFDVEGYDESAHAAAIAKHLGTDHTELRVTPQHALDVVPDLATWYDEPFADSSQIPTFLISKLAREHVTVSLSGDGGDELFAGYERHKWGEALWRRTGWLPRPAARLGAAALRLPPDALWRGVNAILPHRLKVSHPALKAHKLADVLALSDPQALYRRLVTAWDDPNALVPGAHEPHGLEWDTTLARDIPGVMEQMQVLDALTYLPDDILTKVDRASMAVSLEARVPLLDHRIAEFAFGLPRSLRHRGGQGKWLLRKVLARYVPPSLFERPKMGFGIPVGPWLRGPLRDWAENLLSVEALEDGGYLASAPIRKTWAEHLSGRADWTTHLWTVLMFQAWRERWKDGAAR